MDKLRRATRVVMEAGRLLEHGGKNVPPLIPLTTGTGGAVGANNVSTVVEEL